MKRPILIGAAALIVIAAAALIISFNNRPTFISGDAWEYNLTLGDMPEGWRLISARVETPYDLERAGHSVPTSLRNVHSIQFGDQLSTDVFDVTSQILIYDSAESARSALAAETPDEAEWEKLSPSRTIGDEAVLWHLKTAETAPLQATYRLDVQYLNSVLSLGVTGTTEGMPNDSVVLNYASKVLSNFQRGARPLALGTLGERPDLRGLLLSQAEIGNIDPAFGDHWLYNSTLLPSWTPNSAFENPAGMDALGRLVGYQAWLIKPLTEEELTGEITVSMFQQVTVFRSAEDAQATLEKMAGLGSGDWRVAPEVGDSAKGWTQVFDASNTSAGGGAVAATEISFRVGAYTGSIRVETSAVDEAEVLVAQSANELLGYQLARALASNLAEAGK